MTIWFIPNFMYHKYLRIWCTFHWFGWSEIPRVSNCKCTQLKLDTDSIFYNPLRDTFEINTSWLRFTWYCIFHSTAVLDMISCETQPSAFISNISNIVFHQVPSDLSINKTPCVLNNITNWSETNWNKLIGKLDDAIDEQIQISSLDQRCLLYIEGSGKKKRKQKCSVASKDRRQRDPLSRVA